MQDGTPERSTEVIKYTPQLDGLRFIAVLAVASYHWIPTIKAWQTAYFSGVLVNFFFVLSSYLITKILFAAKQKGIDSGISPFRVIYIFLARRTIRIFPAYYVFLLVVMIIRTVGFEVKDHIGMYYSYLANYQIFHSPTWPPVTSHIWTLAIEEQFYLVWPLIIIFVPLRHLLKVLLFIIGGSVIIRAIFYQYSGDISQVILTQYCIDPFAIGALLTYKHMVTDDKKRQIDVYLNNILYVAIPAAIVIVLFKSYYLSFVFNGLIFSMVSFKIVENAVSGIKGPIGRFLQNKAVRFVGRMSYGIYLYHLLVPVIFWKLFNYGYNHLLWHFPGFFARHKHGISTFVTVLASDAVCYLIYSVLVVAAALISSNLIEKQFTMLKKYLNYEKQAG